MGLNAVATGLNAGWSMFLIGWGRRQRSPALVADGWHLCADVATSVGVLIGLALAALTGWQILDPALAAVVALYIVWAGWRLVRSSVGGLMDEAVSAEVGAANPRRDRRQRRGRHRGARCQDAPGRPRVSSSSSTWSCRASMTVAASHAICDRLEAALTRGRAGRRGADPRGARTGGKGEGRKDVLAV